jgi:hypothetical protein
MSRRWPTQVRPLSFEELLDSRYGVRTYAHQEPMPGCGERCCTRDRLGAEAAWFDARLMWQLGGFDLVPITERIVALLAIGMAVARMLGGLG